MNKEMEIKKMKLDLVYYTFENGKQIVSVGKLSSVKFHNFTKKYGKLIKVTK